MLVLLLLAVARGDTVNDKAWEHFGLLNELRAEGFTCPNGASYAANPEPLKFDCRLWRAAKLHSEDMATQGYFSHTSLDGRSPWDRARDQGISANGENIAAGHSSASSTLQQWKDSDGHCKNMMNPKFHVFAIGYAYESSARYRYYWTQMFKSSDVSDLDTSCYPTNSETTTLPTTSSETTSTETETTSSSTEITETTTTTVTTASSTTTTITTTTTTETETGSTTTVTTTGTGTVTGTTTGTATGTAMGTSSLASETGTGTTTSATATNPETGLSGSTTTVSTTSTIPTTSSVLSDTATGTATSTGTVTASDTSTTFSSSTSSSQIFQSSSAASHSTQPEAGTTTVAFESVEGKLVLEVSDPERFLAASTELKGPLKSFLSELLQIDVSRITIFSFSLARRLRGNLRRLLANLAVDYAVQVENAKVEEVLTEIASGNTTRRSELQETLQEDLAQMNITVEVVDVQVTQTSLDTIDQNDNDAMASALLPALVVSGVVGTICVLCLCGCVAMARWTRWRQKPSSLPSNLPTIHGRLDAGVQKARTNTTVASAESGPYVVSRL